jgi:hypothetical protein
MPEVLETAHEHDMELYPSAIYHHSQKEKGDSQK